MPEVLRTCLLHHAPVPGTETQIREAGGQRQLSVDSSQLQAFLAAAQDASPGHPPMPFWGSSWAWTTHPPGPPVSQVSSPCPQHPDQHGGGSSHLGFEHNEDCLWGCALGPIVSSGLPHLAHCCVVLQPG